MNAVTAIARSETQALSGFSPAQLNVIRRTVAKDCNDTEFDVFVETARAYGLNPFRREIYAIVVNKDKPDKRQLVLVTGIDGFRRKAEERGDYSPADDEPEFTYDEGLKDPKVNPLGIEKCKVTVYKAGKPVVAVCYWGEFAPLREVWEYRQESGKREPTGRMELDPNKANWFRMPRHMIAKCAEAQALRKGWPSTFSGLYAPEEMDAATIDLSPSEWVEKAERDERAKRIGQGKSAPFIWKVSDNVEMVPMGAVADKVCAHIMTLESTAEIDWWRRTNAAGMRAFWVESPHDGHEVKKVIEARREKIAQREEAEAEGEGDE